MVYVQARMKVLSVLLLKRNVQWIQLRRVERVNTLSVMNKYQITY